MQARQQLPPKPAGRACDEQTIALLQPCELVTWFHDIEELRTFQRLSSILIRLASSLVMAL